MKSVFFVVFLILGTVIGSGFSTGKEIAVFFSRFGVYSFFFIPLCFVLFYFVFCFLLTRGKEKLKKYKKSKMVSLLMFVCATIFSSSMFAGVDNCVQNNSFVFRIILMSMVIVLCFFACFKEIKFLSKINFVLIPFLLVILFGFFVFKLQNSSFSQIFSPRVLTGLFGGGLYMILYVVLNISLSSVVIARAGENLTKKQAKLTAFLSAFVLSAFILMINVLVICNFEMVNSSMPLLAMSEGISTILLRFVIMVGCLTTLLSMIYISASCCNKFAFSDRIVFVVCVLLPFVIGKIGFSYIVSFLYPLASYLGIFLLFLLFLRKS